MKKNIFFIREEENSPLKIDICSGEDWEGFDEIIEYLINSLHIETVENIDGPDARRWILKQNNTVFELIHSDGYGNYLLAPTKESEIVIKNLAINIDNHYKLDPSFLK